MCLCYVLGVQVCVPEGRLHPVQPARGKRQSAGNVPGDRPWRTRGECRFACRKAACTPKSARARKAPRSRACAGRLPTRFARRTPRFQSEREMRHIERSRGATHPVWQAKRERRQTALPNRGRRKTPGFAIRARNAPNCAFGPVAAKRTQICNLSAESAKLRVPAATGDTRPDLQSEREMRQIARTGRSWRNGSGFAIWARKAPNCASQP